MKQLTTLLFLFCSFIVFSQYEYEISHEFPFGKPNPNAPEQIKDFDPVIGLCNCKSQIRNQDGTWAEPVDMIWKFKYIMNGMAVQDETYKMDQTFAGSIRQFNKDSAAWYVHYYSAGYASPTLSAWKGNKTENGDIILYKEQKAPNGMEGFYKITFSNISKEGFNWLGEWVNTDESIIYPTWKIDCIKQKALDRIVGTWKIEDKESYEYWEKKSDYLYQGYSYKIKDNKKIITEFLSLKSKNGKLIYNATVPDQNNGKTVSFVLNPKITDGLSFENLEHDFPKKIIYNLVNENTITVNVLGEGEKGFSINLTKF